MVALDSILSIKKLLLLSLSNNWNLCYLKQQDNISLSKSFMIGYLLEYPSTLIKQLIKQKPEKRILKY